MDTLGDLLCTLGFDEPSRYALGVALQAQDGEHAVPRLERRLVRWLELGAGAQSIAARRLVQVAQAAFVLIDGATRFPCALLSETPPSELPAALARAAPLALPPPSPMPFPVQALSPPLAPWSRLFMWSRARDDSQT
jgi:hypothetical protein